MTELMTFDDTKTKPYLHGFDDRHRARGAHGRRLGAQRRRQLQERRRLGLERAEAVPDRGRHDAGLRQNVAIPGFWTETVPSQGQQDVGAALRAAVQSPRTTLVPGYEVLCRKTMGFVDLPDIKDGKVTSGRVDANNLLLRAQEALDWSSASRSRTAAATSAKRTA